MNTAAARSLIEVAFGDALVAVDPRAATRSALTDRFDGLEVGAVAIGKAAGAMMTGAMDALGDGLVSGIAVSHQSIETPNRVESAVGSHPIPDAASVAAGERVVGYLDALEADGVVFLISGGGSALCEIPPPNVSVDELAALQRGLMAAGVPIDLANTVRRSLSMVKNGGLLRHVAIPSLTLLISDVNDAPPHAIASGPTLSVPVDPSGVRRLVSDAGLRLTPAMEAHLGALPDAPEPEGWEVISSGLTAAAAAIVSLEASGERVHRSPRPFSGEARRVAPAMVRNAEPGFTVVPGEATVTVTGSGKGGRNTEAALAAAISLEGADDTVFAALTTDGRDGETDCAGAIIDGASVDRMQTRGIDPVAALMNNDSHPALDASGDLVRTGPTGTNVADLWFTWRR